MLFILFSRNSENISAGSGQLGSAGFFGCKSGNQLEYIYNQVTRRSHAFHDSHTAHQHQRSADQLSRILRSQISNRSTGMILAISLQSYTLHFDSQCVRLPAGSSKAKASSPPARRIRTSKSRAGSTSALSARPPRHPQRRAASPTACEAGRTASSPLPRPSSRLRRSWSTCAASSTAPSGARRVAPPPLMDGRRRTRRTPRRPCMALFTRASARELPAMRTASTRLRGCLSTWVG